MPITPTILSGASVANSSALSSATIMGGVIGGTTLINISALTSATVRSSYQTVSLIATPAVTGTQIKKTITGQIFPPLK